MPRKYQWIGLVYLIILLQSCIQQVVLMFHPDSHIALYYAVLTYMEGDFYMDHLCSILQTFLHLFQCVPVFLFLYQYRPRKVYPWRVLFILKIIFDVLGNSYYTNEFRSMYHYSPGMFWVNLGSVVAFYFPSMLMWYLYAFHTDKILPPDAKKMPDFI